MRAATLFLSFAALSLARPSLKRRATGFNAGETETSQEYQKNWYRDPDTKSAVLPPSDRKTFYPCAGPDITQFPSKDKWIDFPTAWALNEPEITTANGGNDQYNDMIKESILELAVRAKIDAVLLLVQMMQESNGKVTIGCNEAGDCGLLQHKGSIIKFDPARPKETIMGQLEEGVFGTTGDKSYPGIVTLTHCAGQGNAWMYNPDNHLLDPKVWKDNLYYVSFVYNQGRIESENMKPTAYPFDIAVRLQGGEPYTMTDAGMAKKNQCLA